MKYSISFIALFTLAISSCTSTNQIEISDLINKPISHLDDEQYADVYKVLDGTWKGEFLIYKDTNLVDKREIDLNNLTLKSIESSSLSLINSINVTQVYESETPYFQRVTITDVYQSGKEVVSTGVNKIQDGKMWCVVQKPNEMVIHTGATIGENTIIWSRDEKTPLKVEYFQETVSETYYEIIGWGYYKGDDTNLTPKLWFYSKYVKQ